MNQLDKLYIDRLFREASGEEPPYWEQMRPDKFKRPLSPGDPGYEEALEDMSTRADKARRKQNFGLGVDKTSRKRESLVPIQLHNYTSARKVAGWDWDMPLDGYISTAATSFECDCGNSLPVPSYSNCKCGKIWNSYVIGSSGEGKEASIEKIVCREIPVRPGVIVAKKRTLSRQSEEKLARIKRRLVARKTSHYNQSKEVTGGQVSQLDKLYKESLRVEAEGKHRKEPEWQMGTGDPRFDPFHQVDLYPTSRGYGYLDYQQANPSGFAPSRGSGYKATTGDGENAEFFEGPSQGENLERAMDYLERVKLPRSGVPQHYREESL